MMDESTPLVGESVGPSYALPERQWWGLKCTPKVHGTEMRTQYTRQSYRSVFCSQGMDVAVRNVAVVQSPWLRCRYFNRTRGRICCQAVSSYFKRGRLHVVADVNGIGASSLMAVIAGQSSPVSGNIWVGGEAVDAKTRLRLIAHVDAESLFMPLLSVKDNLWFVVSLHCKGQRSWMGEVVCAAASFVNLDLNKKVANLSQLEKFCLQVALELVLDSPVLLFSYPFDTMSLIEQNECTQILSRLCADVMKTVVVSTRSIPMPLQSAADTLLLFGAGGVVLFSGKCEDALSYFNSLRIPKHVPQPLWKGLQYLSAEEHVAEKDRQASYVLSVPSLKHTGPPQRCIERPQIHLYSALCTPPRLTSRISDLKDMDGPPPPPLLYHPTPESATAPTDAVVEVATSGDLVDLSVEWGESESHTMFYAAKYYDSSVHATLLSLLDTATTQSPAIAHTLSPLPRVQPSCFWRCGVLLTYTLKQIAVDAELLLGVAFLSIGLIVLTAAVYSQPENQGGMYNIRGLVFVTFVLVFLSNLAAIESAREQLHVALSYRKRELYGPLSFILCLSVRVVLIRTIYLTLFLPFAVFVLRSSYSLAILVGLVSCTHAVFQYLVVLLPSRRWMTWISYAYFGYSIIFSGFLLNLRTLPPLLGVLSFLRWGYGAVIHTWLHGKTFQCDGAGNTSYCYTGDDYLAVEGLQNDSVASSALILSLAATFMMVLLLVLWSLRSA